MRSALSAEQQALWQSLIEQRLGMVLPGSQQGLFALRIEAACRHLSLTPDEYFHEVSTVPSRWQQLAESLLIHETRFFRHGPSFDAVRQHLAQAHATGTRAFHLWSVGCSTGEEAWSLALMTASQGWQAHVLASDHSDAALNKARQGVYPLRQLSGVPESLHQRFGTVDESKQLWRVGDELRSRVVFIHRDVHQPLARMLDVIFCQNVLIYFRRFERRDIVQGLLAQLRPGGLLVLGLGELASWQPAGATRHGAAQTLIYQKM